MRADHRGDGDGWVTCRLGHRHWGRFGASGLLARDPQDAVLLQHRAPWTHEGGRWGLPGGARDSSEDTVGSALREAREEAELATDRLTPQWWLRVDHGGWSYTTVTAVAPERLPAHAANAESSELRWVHSDEVRRLPLHAGFETAWPALRNQPRPLHVIVDAANVVGARPDGWWHDRRGAAQRLLEALHQLARAGVPDTEPAAQPDGTSVQTGRYPRWHVVLEGQARGASPPAARWPQIEVLDAPADGDDSVAQLAEVLVADGSAETKVVTADGGLRRRLPRGVTPVGPRWLLGLLPEAPGRRR